MNIELLSKMVKELLLDNDMVNLPTLGSFVAEIVPASFSDNGHTINPPYRKLYFRENIEREDDLLVRLYAAENAVNEEVASDVITNFIAEVKELLNSRKSVVLPELGRLRATRENNYFFVPFENIDIYPEGEGLEPVPLKIRTPQTEVPAEETVTEPAPEETPEEPVVLNDVEVVRIDGSSEGHNETAPEEKPDEPAPEETPVEETPDETAPETPTVSQSVAPIVPKSTVSRGWLTAVIVFGSILLAAALCILLFIILSHLCPSFIDSLLWS